MPDGPSSSRLPPSAIWPLAPLLRPDGLVTSTTSRESEFCPMTAAYCL